VLVASLFASLLMTSCGGSSSGGDTGETAPAPDPAQSPTESPPPPAPAPCVPQDVVVQLQGDSIGWGVGATDPNSTPDMLLRAALSARWPSGVTVAQTSQGGAATHDRLDGTDSVPPYPRGIVGNVYITNYGVNDALQRVPVETYKANLRQVLTLSGTSVIMQTPTPVVPVDVAPYADAAREVAAELNLPVADANTVVHDLADWRDMLVDGVHPNDALYQQMMSNAVVPAVMKEVAKLRCEE
jgi:lysophospholipase L1-like esterase